MGKYVWIQGSRHFVGCLWECKMSQCFRRAIEKKALKALKRFVTFSPTYTLIGTYPKELKRYQKIYVQEGPLEYYF